MMDYTSDWDELCFGQALVVYLPPRTNRKRKSQAASSRGTRTVTMRPVVSQNANMAALAFASFIVLGALENK
jgi:hypothetical protein